MNEKYKIIRNADGFPICLIEEVSGVRICTFNSQLATIGEHADRIERALSLVRPTK